MQTDEIEKKINGKLTDENTLGALEKLFEASSETAEVLEDRLENFFSRTWSSLKLRSLAELENAKSKDFMESCVHLVLQIKDVAEKKQQFESAKNYAAKLQLQDSLVKLYELVKNLFIDKDNVFDKQIKAMPPASEKKKVLEDIRDKFVKGYGKVIARTDLRKATVQALDKFEQACKESGKKVAEPRNKGKLERLNKLKAILAEVDEKGFDVELQQAIIDLFPPKVRERTPSVINKLVGRIRSASTTNKPHKLREAFGELVKACEVGNVYKLVPSEQQLQELEKINSTKRLPRAVPMMNMETSSKRKNLDITGSGKFILNKNSSSMAQAMGAMFLDPQQDTNVNFGNREEPASGKSDKQEKTSSPLQVWNIGKMPSEEYPKKPKNSGGTVEDVLLAMMDDEETKYILDGLSTSDPTSKTPSRKPS